MILRFSLLLSSLLGVLPFFLLASEAAAQQSQLQLGSAVRDVGEAFVVDRGPIDHLGHGTTEDLFVELGAGARVSVFSGNLVLSLRPIVRGDAVSDSQMALTYNHLDAQGSAALASGWTYDLGRHWMPGPWGDRVLVDGDGFEDSFLSAPLPNRREILELADDLIREWRRQTPLAERRAGGGEPAFRLMLASDPLFFGEMRLRYLGRPKTDRRAAYRSSRRGERSLLLDDADQYVVMTRHDGGRELYGKDGTLQEVEPAFGPNLRLVRAGRLVTEVEVGGVSRYYIDSDSYGRIVRIRSDVSEAEIQYADRYLHRLNSSAGRYEMSYDEQGRLLSLNGPEGALKVDYDPSSGRVSVARGPLGELRLSDLTESTDALEVRVDGSACGAWTASWSPLARERRLEGAGIVGSVRFEKTRPLPIEWSSPEARIFLEWSRDGRLRSVRRLDEKVVFERSKDGALESFRDLGGAQARMVRGNRGALAGWLDPAGRRTRVILDSFRLPARIEAPGGALLQIQRTRSGLLRQLDSAGHGAVTLRRDRRGLLRTVTSSSGAGATVQRDDLGRVTGFETPGGLQLKLSYGVDGRISGLSDAYSDAELRYGKGGTLDGWQTGRDQIEIERSDTGHLEGLRHGNQQSWRLRRDGDGNVSSVVLADGIERQVSVDEDGLPSSWQHGGGGRVVLERNRTGRVTSWSDELLGDASLDLDSWGRVREVRRGSGRWKLDRDRSGRVLVVEDPVSASTRLTLDASGRLQVLSAPDRLTWHLKHDAMGKLVELRDGGQIWTIRHGQFGLPEVFANPRGREIRLDWDSVGRWRALRSAGKSLEAAYGPLGPTRVGSQRRSYGENGELLTWGDGNSQRRWRLERDPSGAVVSSIFEDRTGGGGAKELARRAFEREPTGRLRQVGRWRLSWNGVSLRGLQLEDEKVPLVRVERDSIGRASRLLASSGARAEILRDQQGDVREFSLSGTSSKGTTYRISRDSAARVVGLKQLGGPKISLLRDPLGRARRWGVGELLEPFQIDISPLDGTVPAADKSLAKGLGIDEAILGKESKLSGSRHVEVLLPGGREVLRFDELRDATGALQVITKVWESTLGSWELDAALGDDPIGAHLGSDVVEAQIAPIPLSGENMYWGRAPLLLGGKVVAPSVDGSGPQLGSDSTFHLTSAGGTVSWLGSGASLDGLQFPLSGGATVSPAGWSSPSLIWVDAGGAGKRWGTTLRGAAAGVSHWWHSLAGEAESLALLPMGTSGVSRAWLRPRQEIYARSALLASEQVPSGAGAAFPPLPGASRLLPGPPESLMVSPLIAMVLSGDLPLRASEHESWLPAPVPAWSIELPGARQLLTLAEHRSAPAVPASWRRSGIAGISSMLSGFVTAAGSARELQHGYDLRPALEGLPGGVVGLLPGPFHGPAVSSASLPVHGRAAAVEALSVDPLSEASSQRAQSASDAMQLFLRATAFRPEATGPLVPSLGLREMWRVTLPSGSALVVDGLGRLLSVDGLGRLHRAWAEQASSKAGIALLLGQELEAQFSSLSAPRWLPSLSGLPEARWGLLPGRLDLSLLSDGSPVFLESVLGSSPFLSSALGSE